MAACDDHHIPLGEAARRACAEGVGRDGDALLAAVAAADAPVWLREVPAVRLLRRVWMQNVCLIQDFTLNWDQQIAICPVGNASRSWTAGHNQDRTVTRIHFSTTDCKACALKPRCTRAPRRLLTPRRREERAALEAARAREAERPFADEYRRAGIEGTLSLGTCARRAPLASPKPTCSICSRLLP